MCFDLFSVLSVLVCFRKEIPRFATFFSWSGDHGQMSNELEQMFPMNSNVKRSEEETMKRMFQFIKAFCSRSVLF